jgi:hypothetical protein
MEVVKDVPMVFGQFGCDDGERKIAVEARSSGKVRGARPPLQVDLEETSFEVCWWNFILAVCCLRVRKAIKMMDYFFNE